jgi:hypothetical protein
MEFRGRVTNGVVVPDNGVQLPEGQEVTILAPDTPPPSRPMAAAEGHSVLDIPPISIGAILRPLTSDDDLLGEMLDDRP